MIPRTLALSLALVLVGCGKDDEDEAKTAYPEFVEQVLSGKIGGKAWSFVAGAIATPAADDASPSWDVTLVSTAKENICSEFLPSAPDKLKVIFGIDGATLAVGKKDLGFGTDSQTITLVDGNVEPTMNSIAVEGFVEVTAIAVDQVQAKMVAHVDDADTVNGTFTMTKCCAKDGDKFNREVCKE